MNRNWDGLAKVTKVALGVLVTLMNNPNVLADGFRNPPEGPVAIGRIGGHIAQIDDLTAVIHNPANLLDVATAPGVGLSVAVGYSEMEYTSLQTGSSGKTEDPFGLLPAICAAVPLVENRCVLGLSVNVPYGRSMTLDKNGALRYAAPYYAALSVVDFRPVLAVRVTPTLSLAGGLDVAWSEIDYRQYVPWGVITGSPAPDGTMRLKANGWGCGANMAAAWQPAAEHRLALTWRSTIRVDYTGHLGLEDAPEGGLPGRNDVKTSIEFPTMVGAAYGWTPNDSWRVEFQVEWLGFSSFDTLDVDAGPASTLIPPSMRAQDWKDTWTYGLAGDWRVSPEWILRAGCLYLQSPVPDKTFTPFMADANQPVLSLGAGYLSGAHSLDIGYAFGIFKDRCIRNNNNPAYDGSYRFITHLMSLSYRYIF